MISLIGQSIGRYHIVEQLGAGGMAYVYKAYDTRLERDVAIKVIRTGVFGSDVLDEMLKRFEREAKTLAKLTHPNIVSIIDYGEYEGAPYLVMPFLPGGTLKERLGKPIPYQEAARILAPIADALAYAHSLGIVHRDVKPANILITASGQPMLTDFGIAKILENDGSTLTASGVGIGTPEYMAPEQGIAKNVDGRADIYSLGIVFYEMVTGSKPFTADTPMAVIIKQSTEPLPKPSSYFKDLPEKVEQIIYKSLAKEPEDRYQFIAEIEKSFKQLGIGVGNEEDNRITNQEMFFSGESLATVLEDLGGKEKTANEPRKDETTSRKSNKQHVMIGQYAVSGGFLVLVLVVLWLKLGKGWFSPAMLTEQPLLPTLTLSGIATIPPTQTSVPTPIAIATIFYEIGSTQVSPIDGMEMVYVPEGEFLMGSPEVENENEYPQHTVYLDAFWIDRTEVTNDMYEKCVSLGECLPPILNNSATHNSYFGDSAYDNYPVIEVTWNMANTYCQWAGRQLPTEAQWEKAAKGIDGSIYPWGDQEPNSWLANYALFKGDTMKVGSYPQGESPYGALDMAGNVWEWVADWYDPNYYQNSPNINPMGPSSPTEFRVVRGGAWGYKWYFIRSAMRLGWDPTNSYNHTGFRCAMPAE